MYGVGVERGESTSGGEGRFFRRSSHAAALLYVHAYSTEGIFPSTPNTQTIRASNPQTPCASWHVQRKTSARPTVCIKVEVSSTTERGVVRIKIARGGRGAATS